MPVLNKTKRNHGAMIRVDSIRTQTAAWRCDFGAPDAKGRAVGLKALSYEHTYTANPEGWTMHESAGVFYSFEVQPTRDGRNFQASTYSPEYTNADERDAALVAYLATKIQPR